MPNQYNDTREVGPGPMCTWCGAMDTWRHTKDGVVWERGCHCRQADVQQNVQASPGTTEEEVQWCTFHDSPKDVSPMRWHDDRCRASVNSRECVFELRPESQGCVHDWQPLPQDVPLVEHDEVCSKCGAERDQPCAPVGKGCCPKCCEFLGLKCGRHGCDWPDEGECPASKEKVR